MYKTIRAERQVRKYLCDRASRARQGSCRFLVVFFVDCLVWNKFNMAKMSITERTEK